MAKGNAEEIKAQSEGLRGTITEELINGDGYFSEAAKNLIKFHGIYQQENRDNRKERKEKSYQFMVRTKLPGGQLTGKQYLAHDYIASEFGDNTLRITTRQGFQFHGVIMGDLIGTMRHLNDVLVTTYGACGDVVRNVMACPEPTRDPQKLAIQEFANDLTLALFPRSNAYHQIWIDDEAMVEEKVIAEPLYGNTYLPRKFKVAIALEGDNCVDVFTNDVGLVAIFDENKILIGFNVLAGGGMGTTHNNQETFPRLADVVGFVRPQDVIEVVKGIVTIHRDYGDRTNRKHARLKYVLHDWGVERFRTELQALVPFEIQDARPMPDFDVPDHMGWNKIDEDTYYLGIPVENGRIGDFGKYRLRSGLRAIIEKFDLPMRLTAQQSLILSDIKASDRPAIEQMIEEYGIRTVEQLSNIRRFSLACVALPTCGLAIAEAERALPDIITELDETLKDIGLPNHNISVRMTGCPNGCARPYVAEIAFVGRSLDKYTVYLAGNPDGTRLNQVFMDLVHVKELIPRLRPVLELYRDGRSDGEEFGDYCNRIGIEELRSLIHGETSSD
jgi:sulfite reductase (ferredoxin)